MKFVFLGRATSAMLFVSAAHADVIADRQAIMKQNGRAAGTMVKTARGEIDYDATAILEAFKTMHDRMETFPDLFPEGSDTGDTEASPRIWEDMDAFKAEVASFVADLEEAIAAAPQDKAAFMPIFQKVGAHCGSCHEKFRIEKN